MGNLHICAGAINTKSYTVFLEQHVSGLPSQCLPSPREPHWQLENH